MGSNSEVYSYHNFMFPFRFDKILKQKDKVFIDKHEYYRDNSFDDRVKIDDKLKKSLDDSGWKYEKYEPTDDDNLAYNERVYFHDFVKDSLYNTQDFKENNKATSYYFSKKVTEWDTFTIKIKEGKSYLLTITNLSLRVFDTGVAILSIELENKKHSQSFIDDILKINDFGRRIYPQYLSKYDAKSPYWTEATKDSLLADSIGVCLDGVLVEENFNDTYKTVPKDIEIASYIMDILGDTFTRDKNKVNKYYIQPSVDDRMFVICWYGNSVMSESLKKYKYIEDEAISGKWYEYVFVDGQGKMVQSPRMQTKLIEESTYDRWMEWGTLYGMTRYSFVSLTNEAWFPKNVLLPHIQTMYFQMFTLLLAQRASILRFSDEITAISDIENDHLEDKTTSLYKNYIRFVNKLYFREITSQDQGLEIYNQARGILKIDDDIKDLDNEIEELHRYVSMKEEEKRTKKMDKLSQLGYIFLPPTLIAGIFGMNVFDSSIETETWIVNAFTLMALSIAVTLFFTKGKK